MGAHGLNSVLALEAEVRHLVFETVNNKIAQTFNFQLYVVDEEVYLILVLDKEWNILSVVEHKVGLFNFPLYFEEFKFYKAIKSHGVCILNLNLFELFYHKFTICVHVPKTKNNNKSCYNEPYTTQQMCPHIDRLIVTHKQRSPDAWPCVKVTPIPRK